MVSVECEILSIECREETDNGDKLFGNGLCCAAFAMMFSLLFVVRRACDDGSF